MPGFSGRSSLGRALCLPLRGTARRDQDLLWLSRTGCAPGGIFPARRLLAESRPTRLPAPNRFPFNPSSACRRRCAAGVSSSSYARLLGLTEVSACDERCRSSPRSARTDRCLPFVPRPSSQSFCFSPFAHHFTSLSLIPPLVVASHPLYLHPRCIRPSACRISTHHMRVLCSRSPYAFDRSFSQGF